MVRGRQRLRALRLIPTPPTRPPPPTTTMPPPPPPPRPPPPPPPHSPMRVWAGWRVCERPRTTVSSRSPATV